MIQGTQAWKDKLNEVNNEVRELLSTYPELLQYLEVDEKTGQFKIKKEG
jgi:hypothetical protein